MWAERHAGASGICVKGAICAFFVAEFLHPPPGSYIFDSVNMG
jgi:hypothetical protein